jgi:hypothetical protein
MMLTTKTKVALAGMAYRAIAIGRAIVRKDHWATIRRGDIQWRLDLSEGIDFSIYLLGAFERSTVLTLRKLVRPGATVFASGVLAQGIGRRRDGEDHEENLFGLNSFDVAAPRPYLPPSKDQHHHDQHQDGCERHSHSNRPVPSSYKLYLSARETGRHWQQHLPSFLVRLESNDLSIQFCLPGRISEQLYSEQERTR